MASAMIGGSEVLCRDSKEEQEAPVTQEKGNEKMGTDPALEAESGALLFSPIIKTTMSPEFINTTVKAQSYGASAPAEHLLPLAQTVTNVLYNMLQQCTIGVHQWENKSLPICLGVRSNTCWER